MKIFKDNIAKDVKKTTDTTYKNLVYPQSQELYLFKYKDLTYYLLSTLYKLIDHDEYDKLMEKMAEIFIDDNKSLISNLKNIGSEDIEIIWSIINKFLASNKLGYSQIEVKFTERKISIYHYDSPFVYNLYEATSVKVCEFLAVFYSKLLSYIFEADIRIKEAECKNEKNMDFCIFEMV